MPWNILGNHQEIHEGDQDVDKRERLATNPSSGIGPGHGAPEKGGNVSLDKDYKRQCREENSKQEKARTKKTWGPNQNVIGQYR